MKAAPGKRYLLKIKGGDYKNGRKKKKEIYVKTRLTTIFEFSSDSSNGFPQNKISVYDHLILDHLVYTPGKVGENCSLAMNNA